jgi:hypothetical protein
VDGTWVTSGVGGSEGAARVLAGVLASAGIRARFEPVSTFAMERVTGGTLVVFSQQLSPNARLVLAARGGFDATILVTALSPAASPESAALAGAGVRIVPHEPADESGLLLRVIGPAVQLVVALRAAERVAARAEPDRPLAWSGAWASVGPAVLRAGLRGRALVLPASSFDGRIGIVALGPLHELATGLRQKLLEGLGRCELWEACGLVHGPLQSFFAETATILVLRDEADERQHELGRRLALVVDPARHAMVEVVSTLPGPLALLELDATLNALLWRALQRHPRDLAEWPGKGRDAAIYEIDARLGEGDPA